MIAANVAHLPQKGVNIAKSLHRIFSIMKEDLLCTP